MRASQAPPGRVPSGLEFHSTWTGALGLLAPALAGSTSASTRMARTRRMPCLHPVALRGSQALEQPGQELRLRRDQLDASVADAEPAGPVDLGELLHPARARRPLHRERVAGHGLGVEVALGRPRRHELAVLLADLT